MFVEITFLEVLVLLCSTRACCAVECWPWKHWRALRASCDDAGVTCWYGHRIAHVYPDHLTIYAINPHLPSVDMIDDPFVTPQFLFADMISNWLCYHVSVTHHGELQLARCILPNTCIAGYRYWRHWYVSLFGRAKCDSDCLHSRPSATRLSCRLLFVHGQKYGCEALTCVSQWWQLWNSILRQFWPNTWCQWLWIYQSTSFDTIASWKSRVRKNSAVNDSCRLSRWPIQEHSDRFQRISATPIMWSGQTWSWIATGYDSEKRDGAWTNRWVRFVLNSWITSLNHKLRPTGTSQLSHNSNRIKYTCTYNIFLRSRHETIILICNIDFETDDNHNMS